MKTIVVLQQKQILTIFLLAIKYHLIKTLHQFFCKNSNNKGALKMVDITVTGTITVLSLVYFLSWNRWSNFFATPWSITKPQTFNPSIQNNENVYIKHYS